MKKKNTIWRTLIVGGRICIYIPAVILLIFMGLLRLNVINVSRESTTFFSYFRHGVFLLMMSGLAASILGRIGYSQFQRPKDILSNEKNKQI